MRWIHGQVSHCNETVGWGPFWSLLEQWNALIASHNSFLWALKVCSGCGQLIQAEARWVRCCPLPIHGNFTLKATKISSKEGHMMARLGLLWVVQVKSHGSGICWILILGNTWKTVTLSFLTVSPLQARFKLPCLPYLNYRVRQKKIDSSDLFLAATWK